MPLAIKWIGFILIFTGCATSNDNAQISNKSVTNPATKVRWQSENFRLIAPPLPTDIFALDADSRSHFLAYYYSPANESIEGHKRLYSYLENFLEGFNYKGKTNNAHLAATERAGNCLSLAVLTTAYASLVDLDIEYRKVNSAPIYQRNVGVMTISSHIQTHLYAPKVKVKDKQSISILRSKIVIDYFPSAESFIGGVVEDNDFVAMYYQNLAAEAIVEGDFDLAYSLLSAAMQLSPFNSETLNTLAVLQK